MKRRTAPGVSLLVVLVLAAAARLLVVLLMPAHAWFEGGDGPWYVKQAWQLAHGSLEEPLRTVGPAYPLALAAVRVAVPDAGEPDGAAGTSAAYLTTVRLLQVCLGVATAAIAALMAGVLRCGRRGSLVAAAGVGLGPAFVIEPFLIRTETLFLVLLAGGVLLHIRNAAQPTAAGSLLTGGTLGAAALTRPVLLLFPVVLCGHCLVHGRRRGAGAAALLLVGAAMVLLPWHAALYRSTGSPLPEGFSSNLWIGAQGNGGPLGVTAFHEREDQLRASGRGYLDGALGLVSADPPGWMARRLRNLGGALLQPHGTTDLGGPSAKQELAGWLREERSFAGLWRIAARPGFIVRLLVYGFHFTALGLALVGGVRSWTRWREWFPVYVAIAYPLVVHGLLPATPRYLFPMQPFLWVLAAAAVARRTHTPPVPDLSRTR